MNYFPLFLIVAICLLTKRSHGHKTDNWPHVDSTGSVWCKAMPAIFIDGKWAFKCTQDYLRGSV